MSNAYVNADYTENPTPNGDYFVGDPTILRGGSATTWADCNTWATWSQQ